ncbi:hypothetical protein [Streptomyces sp. NPDC060205]|uniref:hypothetical protein n=1 Tax=Streptomyces sp. NPDC060205 TaxID=3347072 RepID=UPI0036503675
MIDASVAPYTAGTEGRRAAVAHHEGVSAGGGESGAVAAVRPEPEGADLTTVFDIMGRIFSAV